VELSLTAGDVFDMARQIELDARSFYRRAADASPFASSRRLLLDLADMEQDHAQIFEAMKARLPAGPVSPAPWLNVARFLASGIRQHLAERFAGDEDAEEILRRAIDFERDTVAFFVSMKAALADPADRASLDALIVEELGHVVKLSGELAGGRPARPLLETPLGLDADADRPGA